MNNKTGRRAAAGSYGVKLRSSLKRLTECHYLYRKRLMDIFGVFSKGTSWISTLVSWL